MALAILLIDGESETAFDDASQSSGAPVVSGKYESELVKVPEAALREKFQEIHASLVATGMPPNDSALELIPFIHRGVPPDEVEVKLIIQQYELNKRGHERIKASASPQRDGQPW